MGLFNNISFNMGFLCGLNSWFRPALPFVNPFMGWGMFSGGWNIWDSYSNYSNCCYNSMPGMSFYSILPPIPQYNFDNFKIDDSIWNNHWYDTKQNTTFNCTNTNTSTNVDTYKPAAKPAKVNQTTTNNSAYRPLSTTFLMDGYNSSKGNRLAEIAKKRAHGSSHCARYVREALNYSGVLTTAELGNKPHGSAYMWIGILRKYPEKFKEIRITDTNYKNLPAGAIMVYERGVGGYSSEHGHIQVATGDGKAAHFCIQNTIKKPTAIFIPV